MRNFLAHIFKAKHRRKVGLITFFSFLLFCALFRNFIANDKPLWASYQGRHYFPALQAETQLQVVDPHTGNTRLLRPKEKAWRELDFERVRWAPIPYGAKSDPDRIIRNQSPWGPQLGISITGEKYELSLGQRHWLGTTGDHEDLLSLLIHGTATSLSLALVAVGIASIIGILLGALAAYWGDYGVRIRRGTFFCLLLGVFFSFFYGLFIRRFLLTEALELGFGNFLWEAGVSLVLMVGILTLSYYVGEAFAKVHRSLGKRIALPIDALVLRLIELLSSLPQLLILISLAAVFRSGVEVLIVIIALTGWSGIARLVRGEVLKLKSLNYILAARLMGFSTLRIVWRHVIPNVLPPLLIVMSTSIGAVIIAEATLSFLGIGLPSAYVSWGIVLEEAWDNKQLWWMLLFPGLALSMTVLSFHLLAEGIRDRSDPHGQG